MSERTRPRRAVIDIGPASLANVVSVLMDHGIKIVGSVNPPILAAPPVAPPTVRLCIEGECLPDECDAGPRVVEAWFAVQTYGSQRMTRVVEIKVRDKAMLDWWAHQAIVA